jgi:protein-S-isoprenylcysteine O-methyltransferase Ste14
MIVRHLLSIVALPFTMTVLVPWLLARQYQTVVALGTTSSDLAVQGAGLVLFTIGAVLFTASLWQFIVRGRGTLAPWDPPKHLVVDGPYRYVRNPMISGVLFLIAGEAGVLRSWPHAAFVLTFLAINSIYIPLLEEPPLRERFGAAYDEYCRHVRRVIPRLTAWSSARPPR